MHLPLSRYWSVLAAYLKPRRARVLLLGLLLLSSMGLQLLNPRIIRSFIDAVLAGSPTTVLFRLSGFFLTIALLGYGVSLAQTYLSEEIGWSATNDLRTDLVRHSLRLDMAFHHATTPGELFERVDGDVSQLARFFSQLVLNVLSNLLLLVGVLCAFFWEGGLIGVAFAGFAATALLIMTAMRDFATEQSRALREASARFFGFLEERLGGTEDIRANGAVEYTMRRLYALMRTLWQSDRAAALRNAIFGSAISVWFNLGTVLALALGVILYQRGTTTLGTVYLLYAYVQMLNMPLTNLTGEFQHLQEATASLLRIDELLQTRPTIVDGMRAELPTGPLAVTLTNVTFRYPGQMENGAAKSTESILHDFSLHLAAGRTLGLLGRTGSGKSTIARLLQRAYDPQQGSVQLAGVDIRDVSLTTLRRRVAVVTQDVQIFNASIRDNLTFFDSSFSDEVLWSAIDAAGLSAWFDSLPHGLDTQLAAGGSGLSAGQAQLLAFVRAFLKNPGLVILDEASARLDPATEQYMDGAITRLLHDRTAIVIAHRLRTVQRLDEILVLAHGQIIEHGERTALAINPQSHFAQLMSASDGGFDRWYADERG